MSYKIIDGKYWVRKELYYFGSGASFDELKREVDRVAGELESGQLLDAELVMQEEDYSDSDKRYAYLMGHREATDAEVTKIKDSEEKANQRRLEYEKAQYEELKSKFEKT